MASIAVRGALKLALVLCVLAAFWNGACTTEPVKTKAQILISPAAVSFADTVGNASPPAQSVAISTDGQGTVSGLSAAIGYTSGSGWLAVSLSDTTAPATMTLTPSMTGLAAGTYQATVTVSANDAANTPITVPVTFEIAPPPPVRIVVTPAAMSFNDTAGTSSPGPQTASITAEGVGTVTGLKATVDYASGAAGWLTATLSDTTAPATLTLTARNAGLNAATYRATVNVTGTAAGNSPAVSVTYAIAVPPPVSGITIVATANLGKCGGDLATETAKVIAQANPDYVLMLGTSAMPESGRVTTLQDYMNCYQPTFGQFLNKTYATLGDHEVDIDSIPPDFGSGMAAGADAYFGPTRVGPPGKNWQSFDLGSWHVIALNVQTPGGYKRPDQIAYHAGTQQLNWLHDDLRAHTNKCTLAFWYESMWISSTKIDSATSDRYPNHGYRIQDVRGVWTELYNANADLVINGWPRIYERFAPMRYAEGYQHPTTSEYAADSARGIRQITTGLGGDGPVHADSAVIRHPLSEYRSGGNGVLKIVLGDGVYSWEFLNTKYSHIQDSGRGSCH